ncbi:MAG: S-layer homology domain-containing protein [Oscillospiraceae bacterium]|nr:S-layer homology domain-containing protein [Oscillospiraceae bacterium]
MKKRLLAAALALLCLLSLLPAASATATAPCLILDSKTVLIGDSNTVGLKRNNTDIRAARIFARVNGRIEECVKDYPSWIVDGYSQSMYQLITGLSKSSFHTVVINMGTNNCGSSVSTFKNKYRELLNLLLTKNPAAVIYVCKILPINPNNYTGSYPGAFTLENVNKINAAVAQLQAEFAGSGRDVRLLDLHTPMADSAGRLKAEYDSGGGIHLSAKGYKYMNTLIQTALAKGNPNGNHQWGSPTSYTAPTCTEAGWAEYRCSVCGAQKGVVLPAGGAHQWDGGTVLSVQSCETPGQVRYVCTRCGTTRTDTTPALGHAWVVTERLVEPGTDGAHSGQARYTCTRCGKTKTSRLCAAEVFIDMPPEGDWSHDPLDWAWIKGVTGGTGPNTISPEQTVTRAQAVTFLWALAGRPAPAGTESPFSDVSAGVYYYSPVLWAVEQGITGGTGDGKFSPDAPCSRAQIVTFLWAAADKPEPALTQNPFTDVRESDFYYQAVLWAVENGVTGGVGGGKFAPDQSCTRAQAVTFLYKASQIAE